MVDGLAKMDRDDGPKSSSSSDRQFPGHFASGGANEANDDNLQDAALSIPDFDTMSVSSLQTTSTDRAADEITAAAAASAAAGVTDSDTISLPVAQSASSWSSSAVRDDTNTEVDWNHLLGLSGQGLNAANAATSFGFAAARQTTSFSLALAKRITQGVIALPAMALDGTLGNAPSLSNYAESASQRSDQFVTQPTIASIAHSAVGGLFDVISSVAVGGINIGTAVTGAGFGAAVSGVEGVRRALGSEVLRSLGAFSRLVRREWNSESENLPPGGIPQYSILGVTQALTTWVSIQTVTREYYEKKMLRNLDVVDLKAVHERLQAAKEKAEAESASPPQAPSSEETPVAATADEPKKDLDNDKPESAPPKPKKKKRVRILDDEPLPGDEGDIIDAEIGEAKDAVEVQQQMDAQSAPNVPAENPEQHTSDAAAAPQPLTDDEAIAGLKRYSRLVLGVYGGVALAWLGSLPPDLMQAAGTTVEREQAQQGASSSDRPAAATSQQGHQHESLWSGRPRGRSAVQDDRADFLRAAASLDLDESELIGDEADSVIASSNYGDAQTGTSTPTGAATNATASESSSSVLFSAEDGATTPTKDQKSTPSAAAVTDAKAAGRSYSYYDVLMGTADGDIFHRLGGLQDGQAREGDYVETSSQAGTAQERLRRLNNPVARPSKPRYYVVTDHTQRKIVLVLRGSLSLGDIAIDLTCESANFDIQAWDEEDAVSAAALDGSGSVAGSAADSDGPAAAEDFSTEAVEQRHDANPARSNSSSSSTVEERRSHAQSRRYERSEFIVHEGMYETAKEIGEPGRPVHRAVQRALLAHPSYDLDITGHSLGAGVATLLALMWASPTTGKTTSASQLPPGRTTHAYAFAVPCVMGAKLGKRAESLVTSYCYSYDLVCRLSLGAILDIRNACAWLAYENQQPRQTPSVASAARSDATSTTAAADETYGLSRPLRMTNVLQRAFVHQSNRLNAQQKQELEADFLALRKTLEASMNHVELYPPGTVLYSLPSEDIAPGLESDAAKEQVRDRAASTTGGGAEARAARNAVLYRLRDDGAREEVFGQIIHCRGMLSRHMPHLYHYAIDAL